MTIPTNKLNKTIKLCNDNTNKQGIKIMIVQNNEGAGKQGMSLDHTIRIKNRNYEEVIKQIRGYIHSC